MSELIPCPFCGKENTVAGSTERMISGWWYACEDCFENRKGGVHEDRWNTRPIEDALNARIAELSQAVGLITTLKPTMVMDTEHPLDMAKEVVEYVTVRIAELEAEIDIRKDQLREAKNILIDKNLQIDSLYEEGYKLQQRIAELEGKNERFIVHSDIERQDDKWIPEVQE